MMAFHPVPCGPFHEVPTPDADIESGVVAMMDAVTHLRELCLPDHDAVVVLWRSAGRMSCPRAELESRRSEPARRRLFEKQSLS